MNEPVAIVPYTSDNPLRRRAFLQVCAYYREHFPEWRRITACDTDRGGFHKALAVNRAAALTDPSDVLLLNDADSICPPDHIREAVRLAGEEPGLVFAYTEYVRMDAHDKPFWHMADSGSTGCVAIRRACFDQAGGMDESYYGWGYEDLDFVRRCEALWPLRRVPGSLYHIWHGERREDDSPADSDPAHVAANLARYEASRA